MEQLYKMAAPEPEPEPQPTQFTCRLDGVTNAELEKIAEALGEKTKNKTLVRMIEEFRKLQRQRDEYYANWMKEERSHQRTLAAVARMQRAEKEKAAAIQELNNLLG